MAAAEAETAVGLAGTLSFTSALAGAAYEKRREELVKKRHMGTIGTHRMYRTRDI